MTGSLFGGSTSLRSATAPQRCHLQSRVPGLLGDDEFRMPTSASDCSVRRVRVKASDLRGAPASTSPRLRTLAGFLGDPSTPTSRKRRCQCFFRASHASASRRNLPVGLSAIGRIQDGPARAPVAQGAPVARHRAHHAHLAHRTHRQGCRRLRRPWTRAPFGSGRHARARASRRSPATARPSTRPTRCASPLAAIPRASAVRGSRRSTHGPP